MDNIKLDTVPKMISYWGETCSNSISIMAENKNNLTYHQLYSHIRYVVNHFHQIGIGRNDRVVTVLNNGPEMAVAFLGISSCSSCAPLNPAYTFDEFDFFFQDLKPSALVTQPGINKAAIEVAEKYSIPVLNLKSSPNKQAGIFTLSELSGFHKTKEGYAETDDVALILHTSGTTSRPKMVPLTHTNICTSASNISQTLSLVQDDRCLNIMPLFHIHGLMGATLSTITAGASIVCTPGFIATRFYEWLELFQPTWYTAVPTMHQLILSREKENSHVIKNSRLRFIRSSSSSLPPIVMKNLEKTFSVPVIESYGMTEAAHQMASNPLPPDSRKAGTVGKPAGPDITILDEDGKELLQGEIGEIAIKGNNVMRGYENNEKANKESFVNGWFRTGDEGYFDVDNYLVIKDRIKEIINRGGEKISPREVDEVILSHSDVEQVVTFAVPHPILGEEIGAAIILNKKSKVTKRKLQEYISRHLANFKIPRHIVFLDEIPKGPTGKLKRIGLAKRLDVSVDESSEYDVDYIAPETQTELMLEKIWSEVLEIRNIGINDNFFWLGGDSIIAGQIITKICDTLSLEHIPLVVFLYAPTIKQMSKILKEDIDLPPASLVAIQKDGEKTPIYCVHACTGEILFLTPLSQELGTSQPFYGLRARGLDGKNPSLKSVEEMALQYLREIESLQPKPPYIIGGAGVGSLIALEMARILNSENKQVEKLLLFDMPQSLFIQGESPARESRIKRLFQLLRSGDIRQIIDYITRRAQRNYRKIAQYFSPKVRVFNETWQAGDKYVWKPYSGSTILFISEEHRNPHHTIDTRIELWKNVIKGKLDIHVISGMHIDILKSPSVESVVQILKKSLQEKDLSVNE